MSWASSGFGKTESVVLDGQAHGSEKCSFVGKLGVQRNAAVEMQGQTPDSEKAASLDAWTSSEFREMLFRWS